MIKNIKINKNIFKKFPVVLLVTDHTRFNYSLIEKETKYLFDTRNKFKRKIILSNFRENILKNNDRNIE